MKENRKSRFAVMLGNRGFFPASLLMVARGEISGRLGQLGHEVLMLPPDATRHGAVETAAEGQVFANFLQHHRGQYDGVIICLPNFGDETGAVAAVKDAGVPILVVAYPDELGKMAPECRRDAFCGKFSVMDVLMQYGVKFTVLKPHVVHPGNAQFAANIDHFDRLCRVVNGMKTMTVGAIGARTTAFKTVRIDELALQKHGITMETFDLSDLLGRAGALATSDAAVKDKRAALLNYTCWTGVPAEAIDHLAKVGVALDKIIDEASLDAVAIRCWLEFQQQLGISPCVLLSEMNDRGMVSACEVDVGNAVAMYGLHLVSGECAACLDWNNNYGQDDGKCILFHCGPVPQKMMTAKGNIAEHSILKVAVGPGRSFGCNIGRIAPTPFTYGSMLTRDGQLRFFLGQGQFTKDPIPDDFFGCGGVAEIPDLQNVLHTIALEGHRHHVSVTPSYVLAPVQEAWSRYLGYHVTLV